MMKLKLIYISIVTCFFFAAELNAKNEKTIGQPKIAKCKDENGVWHYGSSNLHQCADSSKITTLNERGVKLKEVEEVKTQEQLADQEKKKEQERLLANKKELELREKNRILAVYQSEDDIEKARLEKMASYDTKITQHKNYIEALNNREKLLISKKDQTTNAGLKKKYNDEIKTLEPKKIKSHKRIAELEKERLQASAKYDNDLVVYKKYKS